MASRAASVTATAALLLLAVPLAAQQSGRLLQVDAAGSRIYVVTHRTGLLSFLGHEHAMLATRWTSRLCWDAPTHAASHAELVIDARALEIDADSARAMAGLGKGPSPAQRAQIQRKLHDQKHLDSEAYPEIRFQSRSVRVAGDTLFVRGALTIRNQTRDVELPITKQQRAGEHWWLAGTLSIRQTQFGIRPESIAAVVKVADVVDLHIGLLVTLTSEAC